MMFVKTIHLSRDYSLSLMLLHKVRDFSDGLSLFEFIAGGDWYDGDHCPKYAIKLVVANFTIFELELYNVHHKEDAT